MYLVTTIMLKLCHTQTVFLDVGNNCSVIQKYLWFLLVIKSQVGLKYYCNFLPPFITDRNAKFWLEVNANKMQTNKNIFASKLTIPWILSMDLLWSMDSRLRSPTFGWYPEVSRTLVIEKNKKVTHHINFFFSLEVSSKRSLSVTVNHPGILTKYMSSFDSHQSPVKKVLD